MLQTFTQDLDEIGAFPFTQLASPAAYDPPPDPGISKYRASLGRGAELESVLINQSSDVLLVSCHGALNRQRIILPRFERMRTFLQTPYSSLFFADPTLRLGDRLSLAWYTGWRELDLYPILADWVKTAARAIGATEVLFIGSSGGGFASLQISSYVDDSVAIPLNPQTAIHRYRPAGTFGHQRNYLRYVMPHLVPDVGIQRIDPDVDWSVPLGERASVVLRYQRPQPNYVLYAQNVNDIDHYVNHYKPFRAAIEGGPNNDRVRFVTYEGPDEHVGPKWKQIREYIDQAIAWRSELEKHG